MMFRPCAVIPVYNHARAIEYVVRAMGSHHVYCVLVDDGSTLVCAQVLDQLAKDHATEVTLVRHAVNQGKGAAVLTGIRHAATLGFTHALQIDADGQHNTDDVPLFIRQAQQHPDAVIAGYPIYDHTIPKLRLYARYLTHVWVWINTLSMQIKDAMCGFRVYPVQAVISLAERVRLGARMNFDPEILVRWVWQGMEIINVPTRVCYPTEGVSHFLVWRDNVLIARMHATLFFGMLWRLPRHVWQRLRCRGCSR